MGKRTAENHAPKNKLSKNPENFSTDGELCFWTFKNIDRDGRFAFNPNRRDFDAKDLVAKLIGYSSMTWREIKRQTHDNGKSKHHEIDPSGLSKTAIERIKMKKLEENTDALFSFALSNKTRVIGIRKGAEFQAIWYDSEHEFVPSKPKHT